MEQDVDNGLRPLCCACLSSDRNLVSISSFMDISQIFELIMYDFAGDRIIHTNSDLKQLICWECLALMKKFAKFKKQVHSAQEHLRIISLGHSLESMDHTYLSHSLSPLECITKADYDKIYTYFYEDAIEDDPEQYIGISTDIKTHEYDVAQALRENITLVPEIMVQNPVTGIMSHIVVSDSILGDTYVTEPIETVKELPHITIEPNSIAHTVIINNPPMKQETEVQVKKEENKLKSGYTVEYMTEDDMLAWREEAKKKIQYVSSVYKCELCILSFFTEQQVEDHFIASHRVKDGHEACKVCYVYVEQSKLAAHVEAHYLRYVCKICSHQETSPKLISSHVQSHLSRPVPSTVIQIGDAAATRRGRKKKKKEIEKSEVKPGDLRKLLSKTTITGYKCLECDMFFKNSRARKNHVARFHREGLQCDHCQKRFVNRTTLATHLKLHEGPLPRGECPVCHKMVRLVQLKYHIQRHQNSRRYECVDCNKTFSHLTTYQAHLKYSRSHASDQVFKFPCPMCNKGYPTKQNMQDHFNYQHLGKTTHKCPICNKPIASKANVEKHMLRIHGEKKEKPRNHVCQLCGKGFTDKKALNQHAVIHSGERPLTCDICQQTFKQKASLYTHRKRVHKVFPNKKVVEFMDVKLES